MSNTVITAPSATGPTTSRPGAFPPVTHPAALDANFGRRAIAAPVAASFAPLPEINGLAIGFGRIGLHLTMSLMTAVAIVGVAATNAHALTTLVAIGNPFAQLTAALGGGQ
jgi:hypothetical protein